VRIAIVKPDYRIVGGFELVLRRITRELERRGDQVEWLTIDVNTIPHKPYGVAVPPTVWEMAPDYFRYLALSSGFEGAELAGFDLVISTQPPSFAVAHHRHLALFYHHLRIYYELSDAYLETGEAGDPAVHEMARQHVRALDRVLLTRPRFILAASEVVKARLHTFNGLDDNVGVFHAGTGVTPHQAAGSVSRCSQPICVSRHEFPKRTELFVLAMKHLPDVNATLVGRGGRLDSVRNLDNFLSGPDVELDAVDTRRIWLKRHGPPPSERRGERFRSNIEFRHDVSEDELARLYAEALCVVAPAYLEDYGLTAIEAMYYGKPLVVCSDGGGLTTFVEPGKNGLIVPPSGRAIAAAVQRLRDNPDLAAELGANARDTAASFTWERAMREIDEGIERVVDLARRGPWRP
jgi:glycosyltransferase involved in cell wall biosynthesis